MSSHVFALAVVCSFVFALALVADEKAGGALNFKVEDIDGNKVNLAEKYKGKVLLIVNVASECGYTKQYKGLEALNDKYHEQGLEVLGFPCNQFGGQEPGTEAQIKQFCKDKYDVSFDLFKKVEVKGDGAAPLYQHLTQVAPEDKGEVKWNFEKFLVGRDGQVVKRYRSKVTPEEIASDIEAELAKPAKS